MDTPCCVKCSLRLGTIRPFLTDVVCTNPCGLVQSVHSAHAGLPTGIGVCIGDYDLCACVGTHVSNTAEKGTFRVISHDYNEEAHTWRMRFKLVE